MKNNLATCRQTRWLIFFLFVPGCFGLSASSAEKTATSSLPADVVQFTERRSLCDHFRGEEPYDAARRRFLEENLTRYCTGTDRELAALRSKYKNNAAAMKALRSFEDNIEASSF